MNLLLGQLGDDLLPVAHLSSTSVISEIKYGPEPKLIAYPKDTKEQPKTEDLSSNAAQIISSYVYQSRDEDVEVVYKKVELFWPCEWLKGGVSLVDSPGVGESEEMTNMVKEYIPLATSFIYVINTENAGGIHPDRVSNCCIASVVFILIS